MQLKKLCICRCSFNESLVTTFKGSLYGGGGTLLYKKITVGEKRYTEKAQGVVEYSSTLSLTYGVDGQSHAQAVLPPGRRPSTHCTGG